MTKTMTEKQIAAKEVAKEKAIYNLFKKITKSKQLDNRKILKLINLKEDGTAVATDSHRLLQVTDFHSKKEYGLLDGATGEAIEVTVDNSRYPDTTRLIPNYSESATLNVSEVYDLIKRILEDKKDGFGKKKFRVINLKLKNGKIFVRPTFIDVFDKFKVDDYSSEVSSLSSEFETNLNPAFLLEGLLMFKQAKIKEVKLRYTDSKVRPFVLESENITYLITPVRVV